MNTGWASALSSHLQRLAGPALGRLPLLQHAAAAARGSSGAQLRSLGASAVCRICLCCCCNRCAACRDRCRCCYQLLMCCAASAEFWKEAAPAGGGGGCTPPRGARSGRLTSAKAGCAARKAGRDTAAAAALEARLCCCCARHTTARTACGQRYGQWEAARGQDGRPISGDRDRRSSTGLEPAQTRPTKPALPNCCRQPSGVPSSPACWRVAAGSAGRESEGRRQRWSVLGCPTLLQGLGRPARPRAGLWHSLATTAVPKVAVRATACMVTTV